MISIIKKASGANITVGQNGLVLINGKTLESENLAISAIRKVEEESHTQGLTDRMNDFIKKKLRSE
jgi:exosome complex component RRP4